jgi:hypothetical protein
MASTSRAATASARPTWPSGANMADRALCDMPLRIVILAGRSPRSHQSCPIPLP